MFTVSHYLELNYTKACLHLEFSVIKTSFFFLSFHAVASLAKPGTFAGNDAIVAFARNHQLNVVIHQLNAPLWQVGHLFRNLCEALVYKLALGMSSDDGA